MRTFEDATLDERELPGGATVELNDPTGWLALVDYTPGTVFVRLPGMTRDLELRQGQPLCLGCPTASVRVRHVAPANAPAVRLRSGIACPPAPDTFDRARQVYVGEETRELPAVGSTLVAYTSLLWRTNSTGSRGWSTAPRTATVLARAPNAFRLAVADVLDADAILIRDVAAAALGGVFGARLTVTEIGGGILPLARNTHAADQDVTIRCWLNF